METIRKEVLIIYRHNKVTTICGRGRGRHVEPNVTRCFKGPSPWAYIEGRSF